MKTSSHKPEVPPLYFVSWQNECNLPTNQIHVKRMIISKKSTYAKVHDPHTNCLKCFPWCYYTIIRQAIPMARSYQYQWLCKISSKINDICQSLCLAHVNSNVMHNFIKIFKNFQEIGPVSLFFRIWTSATPRPIPNDIWQSLGLHLVNINVYAKFHHNSPLSSAIFTFSEFGVRHSLDRYKCHFAISWARFGNPSV